MSCRKNPDFPDVKLETRISQHSACDADLSL